jgi:two-component system, OmpR family, response regulator
VRVLVVEDDEDIARILRRGLMAAGHAVDVETTGSGGLWAATEHPYGAILLDVSIPAPDGFEVCRRLRAAEVWTPILLLTGRGAVSDRVTGLDAGADDYLAKPFVIDEVLARLRAISRRGSVERPAVLRVGDVGLDPARRTVERSGVPVELRPKEFAMLEVFLRHPGQALTRRSILERVWDFSFDGDSNIVDVHVRHLRERLDRPFGRSSIETVRGVGYRFNPEA